MAVAFAQTQPRSFVGAEVIEHSMQISSHTSAESSNDSDDDYDYVATLAEQIAHAMLDDDDCQEDAFSREQEVFGSCCPFRKNVFSKTNDSTHDSWFFNSNLSSKISQGRTSPLSAPFYLHSSPLFSRNHGHTKADRSNGSEGLTSASSPGEDGVPYATLAVSESHSAVRERLSHLTRQSNVAALPLMSTSPPASESFSLPAMVGSTETITNASKFPSQPTYSDGLFHIRHNHGSLEWQYRGVPCSNGRSRSTVGRRHRTSRDDKGARASNCRYSVQASRGTSPLQSLPLENVGRTAVHAVVMDLGSGQKEKIGTGVFLPRAHSISSNHRRKSDGGLKMSKTAQVPKNFVETKVNISRHGGEYLRKSNFRTEWTH